MWKYAGELRPGDVWTERTGGGGARSYRVVAIDPGPTATTITVTGLCVTTGQPRTMDFFLVNRVFVGEEPASASDEDPQRRFRADNGASSAVALGHSNAPPSYAWPAG